MKGAREPARTVQDLTVWQKAHEIVLAAYQYSSGFPKPETYGLYSDLMVSWRQ